MAKMDPFAPAPTGEDLTVDGGKAAAPLAPVLGAEKALTTTQLSALHPRQPKRPRKPKEKPPIGEDVPRELLLNRPESFDESAGMVEARIVHRPSDSSARRPLAAPASSIPGGPPPAPVFRTFIGGTDTRTVSPPDTSGGVGRAFVLTAVNDMVYVHDRAGTVLSALSLDIFWQGLFGGQIDTFDPRIVFDPATDRFYFATMAGAESTSSEVLLAVSSSNDPRGAWQPVRIGVDPAQAPSGPVWLDFPSIGFSDDKITVTVNLFKIAGNQFVGASIYVFEKSDLLTPTGSNRVKRFDLFNKGATFVPAVTRDPKVADHWLVNRWSGSQLALYRVTGSVATGNVKLAPAGFVMSPGPPWNSFGQLPSGATLEAPQMSVPRTVDAGNDRILALVLRGNVLHASHGIYLPAVAPDRTAAQIWQIDATSFATTTVRIDHPAGGTAGNATPPVFVSFPTIDVNDAGDLLVGHAWLSADLHPSGALTFLPGGDHKAATTIVFANGLDTYESSDRWGDYSITQVDPANDHDFWTQQEMAAKRVGSTTIWQTVWAALTPPPPAATT
jgi:hypothetical protein